MTDRMSAWQRGFVLQQIQENVAQFTTQSWTFLPFPRNCVPDYVSIPHQANGKVLDMKDATYALYIGPRKIYGITPNRPTLLPRWRSEPNVTGLAIVNRFTPILKIHLAASVYSTL